MQVQIKINKLNVRLRIIISFWWTNPLYIMERRGKNFLFNKYEQDAQVATDRSLHSWRWNRLTVDSEFVTRKTSSWWWSSVLLMRKCPSGYLTLLERWIHCVLLCLLHYKAMVVKTASRLGGLCLQQQSCGIWEELVRSTNHFFDSASGYIGSDTES